MILENFDLIFYGFVIGVVTTFITLRWKKFHVDTKALFRAGVYAFDDMLKDGIITPAELYKLLGLLESAIKTNVDEKTILEKIIGFDPFVESESPEEAIQDIIENIIGGEEE